MTLSGRLDSALVAIIKDFPGPGGAAAVIKDGEILLRHAWGFATIERRIPFTPNTLFRMCSITKQFTCAAMLDAFPDPAALDTDVAARLPNLEVAPPTARHLAHNQSGLRDYWAIAMLHGSPIEAPFGDVEAEKVIAATRSLHFPPGTRYSYVNQNFRLLSDILQHRTQKSFAELLRTRIFEPAGMATALLAADTTALPDGGEGYEGTTETGFRPAINRVFWTGDAGLGASLSDMIAYERWIDATRDDETSLYRRLAAPVTFADGAPAAYGFGLARFPLQGRAATGHGGALRGWRSNRLYIATERLSVVVMFNHLSDASATAAQLAAAVLDEPAPTPARIPLPSWQGAYLDPETNLIARITPDGEKLRLTYGHSPEVLDPRQDGTASNGAVTLRATESGLTIDRPNENVSVALTKLLGDATPDIAGTYHCDELNADLTIADSGGALHGAVSGFLGAGRMERLAPIAADIWTFPCPRALDHTPPGDWTLRITRDNAGHPTGLILGCWLARNLPYRKV
jgi:D-aminopeptidase